jgi:tRNA threonylcarbamoyl adenosine modification protein (Sua5/YciO/YrdC/YwlC family)
MLLKINPINPQQRLIAKAVEAFKAGGIVVYPTDTHYGIGCDIMNKRAIERIYQLKQRNKNKPFSFICSGLKNISHYAKVSNYAYKTMRRLLPGAAFTGPIYLYPGGFKACSENDADQTKNGGHSSTRQ